MSGDHSHSHGHGAPASFGRAFALGIALNLGFVAVEAGYGFVSGSLALLADAGHNLSDVLGLVVAWGAVGLSRKAPTKRFTYGYRRSSILSALFNGVLLLAAAGAIALEAVQRFGDPQPVPGATIMVVAGIGIVINTATALLFVRGRKSDINIKGAFLHMAADAVVSAGVVIAGIGIVYTGANWIDPAVSLVIVAVILWSTWGLLRDAIVMSLDAVPAATDTGEVAAALCAMPGVARVHDLHIWPMSTTETARDAGHRYQRGGGHAARPLRHRACDAADRMRRAAVPIAWGGEWVGLGLERGAVPLIQLRVSRCAATLRILLPQAEKDVEALRRRSLAGAG